MPDLFADIDGPVHYARWGEAGPPMLLVHGLGGSLANWRMVAPALGRARRVFALDLPGFGRTPPAGRSVAVEVQVTTVATFLRRMIGEPCTLVGNSMGGAISAMLAAEHPPLVSELVLVNPALPHASGVLPDPIVALSFLAYMTPGIGRLLVRSRRRLPPRAFVAATLDLCGVDVSRLPSAVVEEMAEGVLYRRSTDWGDRSFVDAARSLMGWAALRPARFRTLLERVSCPTLLIHGTRDRLVPIGLARAAVRREPEWRSAFLDGVGHVPQLETPDRFLALVEAWLGERDRRGGGAA